MPVCTFIVPMLVQSVTDCVQVCVAQDFIQSSLLRFFDINAVKLVLIRFDSESLESHDIRSISLLYAPYAKLSQRTVGRFLLHGFIVPLDLIDA